MIGLSTASCRVHYEDGAYPDGWVEVFNIKHAGINARNATTLSRGLRLGRYTITAPTTIVAYLSIDSGTTYSYYALGGRKVGGGSYSYNAAGHRVRWLNGPMANPDWNGSQAVEAEGAMLKIRAGARAVATNVAH